MIECCFGFKQKLIIQNSEENICSTWSDAKKSFCSNYICTSNVEPTETKQTLKRRKAHALEDITKRQVRTTPDWSEDAVNGDHLWAQTSNSGDVCYAGDSECLKHGNRMKCSSCKIVVHFDCIPILLEKTKALCKPSFLDGIRQYREREQTIIHHHWVHRKTLPGKCKNCSKSFQSKLSFSSKDIVALICSWCKVAYHNKESCFNAKRIEEECDLGEHENIIVPPSWIVKLPRKGSFKSSLRKSATKLSRRKSHANVVNSKQFTIKPIPTSNVKPLIIFINPRSGGNQGTKLLQKFQWLLNPRQVFDLTQGGPKYGLELFRKVPNLRILACGGDGTVGWILSVLDQIQFYPHPPIAVLPLGTGNDLARALGWGGGYTDEPVSKILLNIENSEITKLDRWELKVEKNPDGSDEEKCKDNLPLNVVNNYFSLGVDAYIALEFHEAREAHPNRFNSRLKNKMFYGQVGSKDLVRRKWKNLADVVRLECDGKDYTPKLKEHKVHAVLFLNIPSYGGGTHPWSKTVGETATDDGLIEVVGLTTYQLPFLQAGGHGTCLGQCKTAKIVTTKGIPMQVDGEACRLNPSIITLSFLNQAQMLAKRKGANKFVEQMPEPHKVPVLRICMPDYERHHYDKELLVSTAECLGEIVTTVATDLETVRQLIVKMMDETPNKPNKEMIEWCFLDSCTAERFFRIDRAQDHLHYLADITHDTIYILDTTAHSPQEAFEAALDPESPEASEDAPESPDTSEEAPDTSGDDGQTPTATGAPTPDLSQSDDSTKVSARDKIPSDKTDGSGADNTQPSSSGDGKDGDRKDGDDSSDFSSSSECLSSHTESPVERLLHFAEKNDLTMVKDLHQSGYSLLAVDESGQTVLHVAATKGLGEIVQYVIACCAATTNLINMQDGISGSTALHKAAAAGHKKVCCALIAGGASLDLCDNSGNRPHDVAMRSGHPEIASYLKSQEPFQMLQMLSQDVETNI